MPKALQFHNSAFSSGSYSIPLDVRRAKIDPKILNSPYTPLRVWESKPKTLNPEPEALNPKPEARSDFRTPALSVHAAQASKGL